MRLTGCRRARALRPARHNARAGDGTATGPRCGAPRGSRSQRRGAVGRLRHAGPPVCAVTRPVDGVGGDRLARDRVGEEPPRGFLKTPPVPQQVEECGREHDVAVLLALALSDTEDHPAAIDVAHPEVDGFPDPQTRGVTGRQDRPLPHARHAGQELEHFVRTEHGGERLRFLRDREHRGDRPRLVKGDGVEEAPAPPGHSP